MTTKKKTKVRDLKPKKDAKGGGGHVALGGGSALGGRSALGGSSAAGKQSAADGGSSSG